MGALKRLNKELRDLNKEDHPAVGIGGSPRDNDIFQWDAYIRGPAGTPWEGGKFKLKFLFPPEYPAYGPVVRFVSRMFHPNVYPDGSICVDILESWSPALTTRTVLLSLQSLLDSPNIESPANPEAAQLFCTDRRSYNRRVRAIAEDCSDI